MTKYAKSRVFGHFRVDLADFKNHNATNYLRYWKDPYATLLNS